MEQLLSAAEVCKMIGVSRATLYRMLQRGEVPQPLTVSLRARRWRMTQIHEYINTIENEKEHGLAQS